MELGSVNPNNPTAMSSLVLSNRYPNLGAKAPKKREVFLMDGRYEIVRMTYSGAIDGDTGYAPTATIQIRRPDESVTELDAGFSGNGPINAVFNAIQKTLGIPMKLREWNGDSEGNGSEAVGKISVRVRYEEEGREYTGMAQSTDVIKGTAQAIMDTVNQRAAFEAAVVAHTV